jgi:hypothetical protein
MDYEETLDNEVINSITAFVQEFGLKLKSVRLTITDEREILTISDYMEHSYITPELMEKWTDDPLKAPIRIGSSPWPDRIEVDEVTKLTDQITIVRGTIIWVTNDEILYGGSFLTQPVKMHVLRDGAGYKIHYLEIDSKIPKSLSRIGSQIPNYRIQQTLYQEMRANDGVLIACNESHQPVFTGGGENVINMNAEFIKELDKISFDEFNDLIERSDEVESVKDLYDKNIWDIYDMCNRGITGGFFSFWEESYRLNQYISFRGYSELYYFGVHGRSFSHGKTFDAESGKLLSITDVLSVSPDNIAETLYNEYIAYHTLLGDGFDELAKDFIDNLKDQCDENAVFWLADDGIHIYFDEYTFGYANGASELIIPYSNSD